MAINFAAASTVGLNNPGTEIITLVKDGSGNFINPPSYDKMRAYLRSGEVPMLFVTTEGGVTGSLYQLVGYSESENKIRFSNDTTTIEFSAGASAPVVSDAGGGGGGGSGQFIVNVYDTNASGTEFAADKTYDEISAAIESGMSVVIHKKKAINAANYDVFQHNQTGSGFYKFCRVQYGNQNIRVWVIGIRMVDGKMAIDVQSKEIQVVTS